MSTRIYLVRHCRAAGQEPDAPLTDEGRAQAERLAEALADDGIARIVSSPFARAVASIEPLAERLRLPIELDARLRERALCDPPRADWLEQLRASFEDVDMCLPGGESSRTAAARALAAFEEARRHPADAVLLVTHGNLLALLLRHLDGRFGFEQWRTLTNPDVFQAHVEPEHVGVARVWR